MLSGKANMLTGIKRRFRKLAWCYSGRAMSNEPCPNCGEPGCDSECLLIGTGAPGRDRARYLARERENSDRSDEAR
jgi:hypothetical protein